MLNMVRATLLGLLLVNQSFAVQTTSQSKPQGEPETTSTPAQSSGEASETPKPGPGAQPAATPALPAVSSLPALNGFGLEDGTPVKLRLTRNLSSGSDKKGDTVDFEVMEDVSINNLVVVPRGGVAWATITEAEPKKRMGRGGKLNVNIDSVRLRDGEKAPLRAVKENKGGGHVGAMTGAMVATGIVFFPAAPLFLFMHGKDINIPKGTEITAYVAGNIPLDKAKFMEQPAPAAVVPASLNTSPAGQTNVTIASTPPGADVEVDGKFVGNSPTTVQLSSGDHSIKISKRGYKSWERTLTTSGNAANVNAELEQEK